MVTVKDRKIFAMALVLVALMSIFVPVVSAVSQTWYLCSDLSLDKTAPGTSYYDLPSSPGNWMKWTAGPAQCDLTMDAGIWPLYLDLDAAPEGEIGVELWNEDSNKMLGFIYSESISSGSTSISTDIDELLKTVNFGPGDHLALEIGWYADDTTSALRINCGSGKSTLKSPSTDPGYPVPELSTLVLFSVGLLALVGYVVYRRRDI